VIGSVDAWGFGDVDVEMVGWGIHFFLSACSLLKVDFNPLCNVTNKISTTNSFFFFSLAQNQMIILEFHGRKLSNIF
jgi:hypothetical protein